MYEARQHKEKVSRRVDGGRTQIANKKSDKDLVKQFKNEKIPQLCDNYNKNYSRQIHVYQLVGLATLKQMSDTDLTKQFNELENNWIDMSISQANRIVHAIASRARLYELKSKEAALIWWNMKKKAEGFLSLIKTREDNGLESETIGQIAMVMKHRKG